MKLQISTKLYTWVRSRRWNPTRVRFRWRRGAVVQTHLTRVRRVQQIRRKLKWIGEKRGTDWPYWTPGSPEGSYAFMYVRTSVRPYVCNARAFLRIGSLVFLILCVKLGIHKHSNVTEPDFSGKIPFARIWQKRPNWPKNGPFRLLIESLLFFDIMHEGLWRG